MNPVKTPKGEFRNFIEKYILKSFDQPTWTFTGLDSAQKAIGNYIANRPFEFSNYLKTQLDINAPNIYVEGVAPILTQVVWGVNSYELENYQDMENGEVFVNISEKHGNNSDFKIVPDFMFPKRILKEFSYEKIVTDLFESYMKHKIALELTIPWKSEVTRFRELFND